MNAAETLAPRSLPARMSWSAAAVVVSVGCAGLVAEALYRSPPPVLLVGAAGCGLVLVPALALVRYDLAVALAFGLLGVAFVDPAPTDLVFVVVIAIGAVTGRFVARRLPRLPVVLTVVLLALNMLSAVEVVDATRAGAFFVTTLYLAVLALWIAAWTATPRRARLVAGGYVFAATTAAMLGVLALAGPIPGRSLMVDGGRARALFSDPNVFGPFLIPAALILLEELVNPRLFRLNRLVKALLVVLLAVASILSFSRGAWANLGVGVVVLLLVLTLRRGGGRKALAILLAGGVAAMAIGATLSATGQTRFIEERAHLQSYDAERFAAQRAGIELAERYPLGVGPGQFEQSVPLSAHSTYIRVLAEQGLPGLAVFLALAMSTLGVAVANALAGRGTYGIGSAALLAAWSGILVNSFVIDTLHWRHLWLVAALVWAGWARRRGR